MPILQPYIPTAQEAHRMQLWEQGEAYRFYVEQRRKSCNMNQLMDLWLEAPKCASCAVDDPFFRGQMPDLLSPTSFDDLAFVLGEETANRLQREVDLGTGFAVLCKRCGRELRPWEDDDIFVDRYHLEEHYNIPLETSGKKQPSKKLQKRVKELYGGLCFGCGATGRKLHIDHVRPRSLGGDAAFRNLQPLCEACGNKKGDLEPQEVVVYSDIYFGPYPSDGYEGLFW